MGRLGVLFFVGLQVAFGQMPSEKGSDDPNLKLDLGMESRYVYDGFARRDPFAPPEGVFRTAIKVGEIEEQGPLGAGLESFDLDQLSVVGILWDVSPPKALILGPQEQMYLVRPKQKIGRNGGYVAAIREGEVVIFEPLTSAGQGRKFNRRILELTK